MESKAYAIMMTTDLCLHKEICVYNNYLDLLGYSEKALFYYVNTF